MADTMITEKLIETRIINRHDTLKNWNDSSLKLKDGEIALAYVENEVVKTDAEGKVVKDSQGNIVKEVVPTYLMKIGQEGKTFSQLRWLAAPASDVYAWAKDPELLYESLPASLRSSIEKYNEILDGLGTGANESATKVTDYVTSAIAALDSAHQAAPSDGTIPVSVIQTDGVVTVEYAQLTNANIAANADISMDKIENLTTIHEDLYGDGSADKPGIKANVQFILNQLGDSGKIMEFIGISSTDPSVNGGKGEITIDGSTVTDFENGDTVVFVTTGKEFIYYNGKWNEIGYASDIESALDTFAKRVLTGGLLSTRLGDNDASDDTETLEAEFQRRTSALEQEVGITDDGDNNTKSLKERTEVIEDTLDQKVPQLDNTNVLKIAADVLIFDCGTASPRTYLGE